MSFFVQHHLLSPDKPIPPYTAALYDYLIAGNGIFLRSQRAGLEVLLPVQSCTINGLATVEPYVRLTYPRVPANLLQRTLDAALTACDATGQPVEILFHFLWKESQWQLVIPEQVQSPGNVSPVDDGPDSSYAQALLEAHSHHQMAPFFSPTDTADEQGFRIYAVLGRIFTVPQILVRAGCHGIHWIIPASTIFELPPTIRDATEPLLVSEGQEEYTEITEMFLLNSEEEIYGA